MTIARYSYSVANDTLNGILVRTQLDMAIQADPAVGLKYLYLTVELPDTLVLYTDPALTAGEEVSLAGLVSSHDGTGADPGEAEIIAYDNVGSGLTAENLQEAVDELSADKISTASNVGVGVSVFKQKAGVGLEFRALKQGSAVTLTQGASDVQIDGPVHGRDHQHEQSLGRSSTSDTRWHDKVYLTTPALTGTYRVGWHAVMDGQDGPWASKSSWSARKAWLVRLVVDGDTVVGVEQRNGKHIGGKVSVGGFGTVVLSGTRMFKVQWASSRRGESVGIQDARIEFWRES